MTAKRSVTIVGGGQSGLQLALGLLQDGGYDVRVVQNRTAEEIATGRVTSSQCMTDDPEGGQAHLFFQVQDDEHRIIAPEPFAEVPFAPARWMQ